MPVADYGQLRWHCTCDMYRETSTQQRKQPNQTKVSQAAMRFWEKDSAQKSYAIPCNTISHCSHHIEHRRLIHEAAEQRQTTVAASTDRLIPVALKALQLDTDQDCPSGNYYKLYPVERVCILNS
jgi:hypothetical protein